MDPATRTEDPTDPKSYHYTPWRSPGHAPVTDACGIAGGTPPAHAGPGVAVFTDIGYAKQGSLGSQALKKGPAMETWKAGSSVEVAWGIRYNHGGGYQCENTNNPRPPHDIPPANPRPPQLDIQGCFREMVVLSDRLCPANESLTEECFQRMPLRFNRTQQQLQWNNGSRMSIQGVWGEHTQHHNLLSQGISDLRIARVSSR